MFKYVFVCRSVNENSCQGTNFRLSLILMAESLTFLWNIRTKVRVRGDYVVSRAAEIMNTVRSDSSQLENIRGNSRKLFREASLSKILP